MDVAILDCVPAVTHCYALNRQVRLLCSFCLGKKFETTSISERAVIGGFIPAGFYAHRGVLVPSTHPVFIIGN